MITHMINRWFRPASKVPFDPVAPEVPVTVIGDIHGCVAHLARALKVADAQQPKRQIICVGDYVDRGPDSAGTLRLLQARPDIICLMGNHEEMLLNFLDDPAGAGPRWLRFGGIQTLESFGIYGSQKTPDAAQLTELADALRTGLGADLEGWLRALPSVWQSGNLAVTHAGADPAVPMDQQDVHTLRWGHPKFGQALRRDGVWVLRGHVIVDAPMAQDGVISIDTGAYARGMLTLADIGGHDGSETLTFAQV